MEQNGIWAAVIEKNNNKELCGKEKEKTEKTTTFLLAGNTLNS